MLYALFTISTVGYFEYRSTLVKKYCSITILLIIGPPKSVWISSFGSINFGKGDYLLYGITDFKFLPISVQALHLLAMANISCWIYGHKICARDNIAKIPGCVEWMCSSTASLIALGIVILSSMHKQPCLTLISRQNE